MTNDLFFKASDLQLIPLADAEIYYQSSMTMEETPQALLAAFIADIPWRAERIVVWGRSHAQPRLIAWYGDEGQRYSYSGINLSPLPWTAALLKIKGVIERHTQATFNSVLLNYYRDHNDSMGFHSDNEPELGATPTIASFSVGERRTLVLKHKTKKGLKPVKIGLQSGSLFVMRGATQQNWQHGINKESKTCGPRVNLTFRHILQKRDGPQR